MPTKVDYEYQLWPCDSILEMYSKKCTHESLSEALTRMFTATVVISSKVETIPIQHIHKMDMM